MNHPYQSKTIKYIKQDTFLLINQTLYSVLTSEWSKMDQMNSCLTQRKFTLIKSLKLFRLKMVIPTSSLSRISLIFLSSWNRLMPYCSTPGVTFLHSITKKKIVFVSLTETPILLFFSTRPYISKPPSKCHYWVSVMVHNFWTLLMEAPYIKILMMSIKSTISTTLSK